jgi:hypothetical protein
LACRKRKPSPFASGILTIVLAIYFIIDGISELAAASLVINKIRRRGSRRQENSSPALAG